MSVQTHESGVRILTHPLPPAGLDLSKVTAEDLKAYGVPKCSDKFPEFEARWRAKAGKFRFVEPQFKPRVRPQRRLPRLKAQHGPQTSDIWAGGIVFPTKSGDTMKWVEGTWTQPAASLPPHALSGVTYTTSCWIGIDGIDGSGDVLQAGCDTDVTGSDAFNPWWEWFPAGSFWITNIPVKAGDVMNCLICVAVDSTTHAVVFLGNQTTGVAAWFTAVAPSGVTLVGNVAEWIVEALETGPDGAPELAKFSSVSFTDCYAGTVGGVSVDAGEGGLVNMVNGSGSCTASLDGKTEVVVTYG
jgi:hypothetical protein